MIDRTGIDRTGIDRISSVLDGVLTPRGAGWLRDRVAEVAEHPAAIAVVFPAAGRRCGRGPLAPGDAGPAGWTVDDAARAVLLCALPLRGAQLVAEVATVYRHGDAAERRGVLRALDPLRAHGIGAELVELTQDALRTNDPRLIAAALGPYATEHLDPHTFRQAVLKCVFVGIPTSAVHGLPARADAELTRMLADYAAERRAAGRPVPPDVLSLIDTSPAAGAH